MDIGPLIPLIFILLWIISALAKKRTMVEREEGEEEDGTSPSLPPPEETLERFLRRLAGEEEKPKAVPPSEPEIRPVVETVEVPPPPEVEEPPFRAEISPAPFPLEPNFRRSPVHKHSLPTERHFSKSKCVTDTFSSSSVGEPDENWRSAEVGLEKEKEEEITRPILESADLGTFRQGIILAEILGPPRAQRPL